MTRYCAVVCGFHTSRSAFSPQFGPVLFRDFMAETRITKWTAFRQINGEIMHAKFSNFPSILHSSVTDNIHFIFMAAFKRSMPNDNFSAFLERFRFFAFVLTFHRPYMMLYIEENFSF